MSCQLPYDDDSSFVTATVFHRLFQRNPTGYQATMSDRPNVITILNSRLPVDFLSQDVAIVFLCCCCRCQRGERRRRAIALMSPLPPKIKGSSPALAICFIGDSWTKQATIRVSVALYVVLALLPRRNLSTSSRSE